jgi:hypothetical protein
MPPISRPASSSVGDGFTSDVSDPFDGWPAVDGAQAAFDPIVAIADRVDLADLPAGHGLFVDPRDPLDGLDGIDPLPGWFLADAGDGLPGPTGLSSLSGFAWDGVSTTAPEGQPVSETFTGSDLVAMDDWSRLDPPTLLPPVGSADGFAAQEFATTPIVSEVAAELDGVDDPVSPMLPPIFLAGDGTAFIA